MKSVAVFYRWPVGYVRSITRPASRNKDEGKTPEELRNERFGCFRFRPKFLQRFNSPVAMLVFICILVAVQAKLGEFLFKFTSLL